MDSSTIAARVAASPAERAMANLVTTSIEQPSFDGQGWLVALNLGVMTAGFFLCAMLAFKLIRDMWLCRFWDAHRHPSTIARRMMLCFAAAGTLRFGGEAAALWGWDPGDPTATLAAAQAKRLLDPLAAGLAFAGLGVWVLAERNLIAQLRSKPLPVDMWAKLPQLKRPALVVALSFAAAIGVVVTR